MEGNLPVWSGDFLEYIDLSQISFDGVCWDGSLVGQTINYKNTNARIDFSKSVGNAIINCRFSGADLSRSGGIQRFETISGCDFSNTYMDLNKSFPNDEFVKRLADGSIKNSLFSGLDLSEKSVSLDVITRSGCFFPKTGLCIQFSGFPEGMSSEEQESIAQSFRSTLALGFFTGCYVNGTLVTENIGQKYAVYSQLFDGLESTKEVLADTVLGNIKGQILNFAKKDQ